MFEVPPCINEVLRRFTDDGFEYEYDNSCAEGTQQLGVTGSSGSCTRAFQVMVVHFMLPMISDTSTITSASFRTRVTDSSGSGMTLQLHGLGERYSLDRTPMDPVEYPLGEADFF
eukprot:SAG22_NODE_330_length_12211_cov_6.451948_10_plen_115_part_00